MIHLKWFNNVITFTLGWIVSLFIWRLIRIGEIKAYLLTLNIDFSTFNFIIYIVLISLIAGLTFGSVQYGNQYLFRSKASYKLLLFRALLAHLLLMLFLYYLVFFAIKFLTIDSEILFKDFIQSPLIIVNLIYFLIINSLIVITIHLNKLFGRGNLLKLITGKFYNPKEEFRVFMFLDLQSSTKLAEDLGHIKYSKLIQDCFYDLGVIEQTKMEIYQYVGDEAVLTFKLGKADFIDNCLDAFFLYSERLKSRKQYYLNNYNVLPVFKAGMHLGIVTVAEVGALKREIAYHGDTINIASRIQGQCKVFNRDFLISKTVIDYIKNKGEFEFEALDQLLLRGKKESTTLYSVSKNES